MSNSTSKINVNVDSKIKEEANKVLNSLGLDIGTAINIFLVQVVNHNGMPFKVKKIKLNNEKN